MIEYDEEEYKQSAVSDNELYLILLFLGPEVKDMFLFGGEPIAKFDSVSSL